MKPGCNLCGASLVEEDCALICGGCARPRDEWLKDQAEQLAIAHQRGAKDALAELYARMRQYMISSAFGPAGSFLTRLEREIDRGEWPPKE
jgi:hypothetical protein